MIDVEQYMVSVRAGVVGVPAAALDDWLFGVLDLLLEDGQVVSADAAGALAAGDVEFDIQVRADDPQDAVRRGTAAMWRACTEAGDTVAPIIAGTRAELIPA